MRSFRVLVKWWDNEAFIVKADRMINEYPKNSDPGHLEFWNGAGDVPTLVAVFEDYVAAWLDGAVDVPETQGLTPQEAEAVALALGTRADD